MKNISAHEKELMLLYWDLGIKPSVIAIIFKRSETIVRRILKANNRTGPQPTPTQALNTWRSLYQDIGGPIVPFPFDDTQQREEQLMKEKNELAGQNTQLTKALQEAIDREEIHKQESEKKDNELEQKNLKIKELEQKNTELTTAKETGDKEIEKLQNTNKKIKLDYQRDLEELITNFVQYVKKLAHTHQQELDEQQNKYVKALENQRNEDAQKFETERSTYEEQIKSLKNEIQTLKGKANTSFWKGVGVGGGIGITVGVLGTLGYQKYFSPQANVPRPLIVDSKYIHSRYTVHPVSETAAIQPGMQNICSGMPPDINTAGAFNCSGAYPRTYGNNTGVEYTSCLNQQDDVTHSPIYYIHSGVELVTNISGSQCSGVFVNSHLENIPIQDATTLQASPTYFIPSYTNLSLSLSTDPSESLLMQRIRMTTGKQFEEYIGKFFTYMGYRVWYTKLNGDYGADLFIERDGVCIVVSCRQRKENTGVGVVQAVHSAKDVYEAPNALIICTSEFTQPAINLAILHHVECWNGAQLLQELTKCGYFLPPE